MKPQKSGLKVEQDDLFRSRLSSILDHQHPLYVLAEAIDWKTIEREFGALNVENVGRPGLATPVLVSQEQARSAHANPGRLVFAVH